MTSSYGWPPSLEQQVRGLSQKVDQANASLALILQLLHAQQTKGDIMSQEMDNLVASVAKNTSVIGSALTLIQGFSAQLAAAASGADAATKATLLQMKADIDAQDAALAAAVTANTVVAPVAPAPAP